MDGAVINLNNCYIKSTGGNIVLEDSVTFQPYEIFTKDGLSLKGIYSSIPQALNLATLGQTVQVSDSQTLSSNGTVPSGVTLNIKSGATVDYGNYAIILNGGSVTIESGVTNNYLFVKNGSTLKAIFGSIQAAVNYSSSGQTVELLPSTTYSGNISISGTPYNRALKGASNGTSVINGNITVTNSNYTNLAHLRMHYSHNITINGGTGINVSYIDFMSSGSVNFYNGNLTIWAVQVQHPAVLHQHIISTTLQVMYEVLWFIIMISAFMQPIMHL